MTLAYSGKSRKRKGLLALSAILAILIGTALAFGGRDGSAFAEPDTTQLNISSSTCISGGASFHFVAPHTADGTGGTLTVEYTINGTAGTTTVAESHGNNSTNAQWDVTLTGSGTFVITSASTSGGQMYTGNGADVGTITCGEQNLTGSITIAKVWSGGEAGTANFTGTEGAFHLTGDAHTTFSDLSASTYTFTEAAMEGWDTSVACTGGSDTSASGSTATVNLAAGEHVTCTFTNTAHAVSGTGNITIVKEWTGGEPGTASFTGFETFSLTGNTHQAFTGLESGQTYTFTEGALDNWTSSATCTGASTWSGEGTSSVSVTLAEGENVTCTFTNTFKQPQNVTGSIVINKEWVDASGNPVTTGLPTSATFTLTGDAAGALPDVTVNAGSSWSATVSDLSPDHYVVEEQAIDGWRVSHFECTRTTSGGPSTMQAVPEADASFNLGAGDVWTCTFVNMKVEQQAQHTVTIGKFIGGDHATSDNTNGASFNMTATWTAANLNGGAEASGSFDLGPTGFNTSNAYEAVTAEMDAGYNYAVVENNVPTSASACTANTPFYLAGYGVSSTSLADAAAQANLSPTASITNGQANMFIAVVNLPCQAQTTTGTVIINKTWQDASGAGTDQNLPDNAVFTYTSDNGASGTITLDGNGNWTATTTDLAPGHYVIEEQAIDGWHVVHFECTLTSGGQEAPSLAPAADASFNLHAGDTWTCTFVNQQNAAQGPFTVTIGKFIGGDHADTTNTNNGSFNLTATWTAANLNGGAEASGSFDLGPTGFNTSNAYEAVTAEMDAGYNYAVVENNVPTSASACTANTPFYLAGYGVSSISLTDAAAQTNLSATADITNGQANMFIAVVNLPCAPVTATGTITLNKVWVDANGNPVTANLPASVNFTATGTGVPGSFSITPSNGTWTTTFSNLAAGNFSFAEVPVTGWTNMGMTCHDAANATVNVTNGGFALAAAAHVTCTVTNQVSSNVGTTGSVTVVKHWIDAIGNPVAAPALTVGFTATGLGTGNDTFTLGTNGVWSQTFSGLTGGQVTIVEASLSGWSLASFTCMDTSNNTDVPVSEVTDGVPGFMLGATQNVVCTLVNQQMQSTVTPTPTTTTTTTPTATPTTPTSTATPPTSTATPPATGTTEVPQTATQQPAVISTSTPGGQAVGGFFAPGAATPGAPSTGSGSSSSSSFLSLFAVLGIVAVAGSSAILIATRKRR